MKLLFDANLSPKLVTRLADCFPNLAHVQQFGLNSASDLLIWEYAQQHNYILVTKDADFHEMSLLRGSPPKVIWIRRGNCSVNQIENILRNHVDDIQILIHNCEINFLMLY